MANGFGLTESDPTSFGLSDPGALTSGSVAAPTAAAPAAAAPAARRSSANPLSAIGFALSSVAAGMQGKPYPKDPTAGEEDLEIKRTKVGLDITQEAAKQLESAPPERHPEIIAAFDKMAKNIGINDLSPILGEIGKNKDMRGFVRALPPELAGQALALADNNPMELMKLLQQPQFREFMEKKAHALNAADIQTTYTEVAKKLDALPPEAQAKLPRDAKGKLALTTSEFAALGKQYGFLSDSQVYTLNSNPDAFAGFLTPPSVSKALETKRGETAIATGAERPEIVKLQTAMDRATARGDTKGAAEIQAQITKIGTVVGRTPEDTAAVAAKEKAKLGARTEADDAKPIPTAVANLLDLPPETTVGEARKQKIAVPREQVVEELQQAKVSAKEMLRETAKITALMEGRPEVLSAVGSAANSINALRAGAVGMARAVGIPVSASSDVAKYADTLQELGITNARIQSSVVGLSYAAAIASGQSGRAVSDRDVERFIKRIGVNQDPVVFSAVLSDLSAGIERRFGDTVKETFGRAPGKTLRQEADADILAKPTDQITTDELKMLSPDGLKKLREALRGNP